MFIFLKNARSLFTSHENLPDKRFQVLRLEKEFSKLPGDSPNIFQRSNIECYMERPSATMEL